MEEIKLHPSKKVYFASDFHLGVPTHEKSLEREKQIVNWLNEAKTDAQAIFLLGDVFDFWFEYKDVVPKGYVRFLGTLAQICDSGIPVYFFTGNHDMWVFDYLEKEIGVKMLREPTPFLIGGKRFLIGHGDGLGPGDFGYKTIKKVFALRLNQILFSFLHPRMGVGIANYFSRTSRAANGGGDEVFISADHEWLVAYAREILKKEHYDFFIFGHRHLPLDIQIQDNVQYINTGDWIKYNTYAVFDGEKLNLIYNSSPVPRHS